MSGNIGEILEKCSVKIKPLDENAAQMFLNVFEGLVLKNEKLGLLKPLLAKYQAIINNIDYTAPNKCIVIFAADHGVAKQGTSAYPADTTWQMALNYLVPKGAAANAFANFAEADLLVIDVGINDERGIADMLNRKINFGTRDMTEGAAMTRAEAIKSIEVGIEVAVTCAKHGYKILLPGEMGIANTTSSAAMAAVLTGLAPEKTTGRGTNISDERLAKKIAVVKKAIEINKPNPADAIDVLAKVGGYEFGAMAGFIIGAAASQSLVILDGFNTSVAALIAAKINPLVKDYLVASQLANEPGHEAVLAELNLRPCLSLDLALSEGCGSSIVADMLDFGLNFWGSFSNLLEETDHSDTINTVRIRKMPADDPKITDKTFDFYLNTMPSPLKTPMEKCRERLDKLAKPLYSLGKLEEIAVEIAGIGDTDCPPFDMAQDILLFGREASFTDPILKRETSAISDYLTVDIDVACLNRELPPTAAFNFGREVSEDISFSTPIIALAVLNDEATASEHRDTLDDEAPISIGERLAAAILTEDDKLKYGAEEFLAHVPEELKNTVAAVTGAIIAGAHNSSLIIAADRFTSIVARYTAKLCPETRPYVLNLVPKILDPAGASGLFTAAIGLRITDASLHVLNDMKTFAETKVSIANDGLGAIRQKD